MKFRKIIHIDMDAFYASVEQLDFPELRGKPIAVGGNYDRGVLSTASYEARKFGVRAAMSSKLAAKKCPDLIFVPPRFYRYQEISYQIHEIFKRYTDVIEPLSLDEAYLDVTFNKLNISSATFIAQSIKNDIRNELQLVASAGISYNKFLAKVASDQDKPDGLFVIKPDQAVEFMSDLPIHNFYGVGKVTAEKLKDLGVTCGRDLRNLSLEFITAHFGKLGQFLYNVARGVDERMVKMEHVRKSIAVENTFAIDLEDLVSFNNEANKILEKLWMRYQKHGVQAKTLSIKIKYSDFKIVSRSITAHEQLIEKEDFMVLAKKLFKMIWPFEQPIRLIGYQLSNFVNENEVVEAKKEPQKSSQLTLDF